MNVDSKRLYNTCEELQDALIDAIGKRDKEKISAIGLYALTTSDEYPVAGIEGFDYTDYVWEVASRRLEQLQDPKYDGYYDAEQQDEAVA